MADAELTTTGAEGYLGGDKTISSKCISCAGSGLSAMDKPCSITSVSETGLLLAALALELRGCRGAGFGAPFADFLAFGEVGEASSMLLVSLSWPASSSSVRREPSLSDSSSPSRASVRPSSSPSSSTRRRWPILLRRGAAAMMTGLRGRLDGRRMGRGR